MVFLPFFADDLAFNGALGAPGLTLSPVVFFAGVLAGCSLTVVRDSAGFAFGAVFGLPGLTFSAVVAFAGALAGLGGTAFALAGVGVGFSPFRTPRPSLLVSGFSILTLVIPCIASLRTRASLGLIGNACG